DQGHVGKAFNCVVEEAVNRPDLSSSRRAGGEVNEAATPDGRGDDVHHVADQGERSRFSRCVARRADGVYQRQSQEESERAKKPSEKPFLERKRQKISRRQRQLGQGQAAKTSVEEKELQKREIVQRDDLGRRPQGVQRTRKGKQEGARRRHPPDPAARPRQPVTVVKIRGAGGGFPNQPEKSRRCNQQRKSDEMDRLKKRVHHSGFGSCPRSRPPLLLGVR